MIHLKTPLTLKDLKRVKVRDEVYISGTIYAFRDAAHKKLLLEKHFPLDLKNGILYYMGPTPPRAGRASGACGPTTSARMDKYTVEIVKKTGIICIIGKGSRSKSINDFMRGRCLYLAALGGLGALAGKCVKESEIILYPELGPEAVYKLEVEDLATVVAQDLQGNNIYGGVK